MHHITQDRVMKDLEHVFNCFKTKEYEDNQYFSEAFKQSLKSNIIPDPHTQDVWDVSQILDFKTKEIAGNMQVIFKVRGDNYWIVNGEPSGVPGEIVKDHILQNAELEYVLEYEQDKSGNFMLVAMDGSDGLYIGDTRSGNRDKFGDMSVRQWMTKGMWRSLKRMFSSSYIPDNLNVNYFTRGAEVHHFFVGLFYWAILFIILFIVLVIFLSPYL